MLSHTPFTHCRARIYSVTAQCERGDAACHVFSALQHIRAVTAKYFYSPHLQSLNSESHFILEGIRTNALKSKLPPLIPMSVHAPCVSVEWRVYVFVVGLTCFQLFVQETRAVHRAPMTATSCMLKPSSTRRMQVQPSKQNCAAAELQSLQLLWPHLRRSHPKLCTNPTMF